MNMHDQIIDLVNKRNHVSFAELHRDVEGFAGDMEITLAPNLIIWQGVSDHASDAINYLKQSGDIVLMPSSLLVYIVDGRCLNIPIAKRFQPYKKPHWLPTVLCRPGSLP